MSDDRAVGDVTRPERFRERRDPPDRAAALEKRRKREAEQRQRDLDRLQWFEGDNGHSKRGPTFNLTDQIIAALANGKLVERAGEQGIRIDKIDEQFGGPSGSSGRSDRYRLAPDVDMSSPEIREKVGRRLMRNVRGYLRLARGIAELMGENADDCALRVMQDTDLWRSRVGRENDGRTDERADRLQALIRKMARFVIREAKLEDSFATLAKIPDRHGDPFPGRYEGVEIDCSDGWDALDFLPGVQLARFPAAELSVTAYPVDRTTSRMVRGESFCATLRLSLDVRLVIGPTTAPRNLGPMFESLPYIEMIPTNERDEGPDDDEETIPAYVLSPYRYLEFDTWRETFIDENEAVEPDTGHDVLWSPAVFHRERDDETGRYEFYLRTGEWVRPIGNGRDPRGERFANLYWTQWPRSSNALEFDPRGCWRWEHMSWRPVDADHVSALLDRDAPHPYDRDLWRRYEIAAPPPTPDSGGVRCFPRGTVAFDLENRLETGELERALIRDSARIDRYIEKWRKGLDERDVRLTARWADDAEDPE